MKKKSFYQVNLMMNVYQYIIFCLYVFFAFTFHVVSNTCHDRYMTIVEIMNYIFFISMGKATDGVQ